MHTGHTFFGSVSKGLANVVEYAFKNQGRPNGYILGQEASGAFVAGLRYGEGVLYTRDAGTHRGYWQGPSIGYDAGAEGSKVMMLVYNLRDPGDMYQRFGGVDGSAYFVGGVGVTFQKSGEIRARRSVAIERGGRRDEARPFVRSDRVLGYSGARLQLRHGARKRCALRLWRSHHLEQALKAQVNRQRGKLGGDVVGHPVLGRRGFPGAHEAGPFAVFETANLAVVCRSCRRDIGVMMTPKRVNLACPLDRPVFAIDAELHLSGRKAGSREEPSPIEIPIDEKRLRIARDDVKQIRVVGRR